VQLHALALAEQLGQTMPAIQAKVDNAVAYAVEARLADLYAPAAPHNYDLAAGRFNDAAQVFTSTAGVIDPDTDAAAVVGAPDDQQAAWQAVDALAGQLDAALPILTVAAQLAGISVDADDGRVVPLSAALRNPRTDPARCQPRRP
jgi:hypothetical protein